MFSKILSTAVVALATSQLAFAQTHSDCNPVEGDQCKPDPALGGTTVVDFTQGESDFFTLATGTTLEYNEKGAVFKIEKEGQAPTITSTKYIFFGKVDVWVQASVGTGVVTSFVLQSDDLDEIDWEWLGGDTTQVQTNYFSKGDTTTYDRGGYSSVDAPQSKVHKYTIDWTPDALNWLIDDVVVRTLTYADAKGGKTYPQTPMQIKLGTWVAGGKDAPEGTVQWAGGRTDFSQAPFIGYYEKVSITDYANGAKNAVSYAYGDTSGTYESIKIVTGDGSSSSSSSKSTSSTSSSSAGSSSASATATTLSVVSSSTSASKSDSTGASGTSTSDSTETASITGSPEAAAVSATASASATAAPKNVVSTAGARSVVANLGAVCVAVFLGAALL
jgi:beta-glucanase (GH16 family)